MQERCPRCGSSNVKNHGFRNTLKRRKRRYKCKDCKRTFYSEKERNRLFLAKIERKLKQKELEYRIEHWYDEDADSIECERR